MSWIVQAIHAMNFDYFETYKWYDILSNILYFTNPTCHDLRLIILKHIILKNTNGMRMDQMS